MSLPVMPTRILIVGGGGREHALAWKLAHEPGVNRVVVAPGSDGIATEPRVSVAPDGWTMRKLSSTGLPGSIVPLGRKSASLKVLAGATVGVAGPDEPQPAATPARSAAAATSRVLTLGASGERGRSPRRGGRRRRSRRR